MRKIFVIISVFLVILSLPSCGQKETSPALSLQSLTVPENEEEKVNHVTQENTEICRAVNIDGVVYYDTGYKSSRVAKCGMMDGQITTQCKTSEMPTENCQSNFGTGYGYQIGAVEGSIEIKIDNVWWIFATERVKDNYQP